MSDDDKKNQRAAAMVNLGKLLEAKKRGDLITASEIINATGLPDWHKFRGAIRSNLLKRGLVPQAIPNDGYRIILPDEHVNTARRAIKSVVGKTGRAMRALASARSEMTDSGLRRADFMAPRIAAMHENARQTHDEIRKELKTSERVPMRLIPAATND